jgi:predicted Zn-dependent protease
LGILTINGDFLMSTKFSRRDFLYLASISAIGLSAGCATNPVSGKSQFMIVSQGQELSIDKQNSPYQFSNDYGIHQDRPLNNYLQQTGLRLARISHRPDLPYSFRCVNATYVNAYAFPGGTIAVTRGILLSLDNEAELAALLGHELGHVNARHTAQQMSKGTLVKAMLGGVSAYASSQGSGYGKLASQLGGMGAGALLASYSRDNERQADDLAMEYMVKGGYNPQGAVNLMKMLTKMSKHNPNALELMFSTHPMSQERLDSAVSNLNSRYRQAKQLPVFRERYMDNTARLRAQKKVIETIQKGEETLAKKQFKKSEEHLKIALKSAPDDYAALTIMAKCLLFQKKSKEAARFAKKAKQSYPGEAQAHLIGGLALIRIKNFDNAIADLSAYNKLLPGNPNITFYKGLAYEGKQNREQSARNFNSYLQSVRQGEQAQYAYQRLVEWGYVQKTK